jgi:hypothetical protein
VKTLVFWGEGSRRRARAAHESGARIVLWQEDDAPQLEAAGVPFERAGALLSERDKDEIDEAAMAWTKAWGRMPLLDGKSFRELADWRGTSLWWFAELYLHHSTASPQRVRVIETFRRILIAVGADEVEEVGLDAEDALLLARTCSAAKVLFHGAARASRWAARRAVAAISLESRLNTVKTLVSAVKARFAGTPDAGAADAGRRRILFLSHAAFWRERQDAETGTAETYEHYFDRLIPDAEKRPGLSSFVVAVGPRAAFRRRGLGDRFAEWLSAGARSGRYVHMNRFLDLAVFRETRRATRRIRWLWRSLRRSPALNDAFSHRGCGFADLATPDLAGTLLLQLPWAVRCCEEMAAALRAVKPSVLCLYAESSGWGRAALAAARRAGVRSVALQHGILYRKYYSYRHDADEADCPRPDRTAVFGEAARRLLIEAGRYPPDGLVTTGSPKFDALLQATRAWDRKAIRARLGVDGGERLLVVASRYRAIRDTHQSIGSAFAGLVQAVESLPDVRCLVKPHPAERPDAYQADLRRAGAGRTRVLPPGADLIELLYAGDALITVESLSAVEALVLGRPVIVLNMPTHLGDLVEAGVALGVPAGGDPRPCLEAALHDGATRAGFDAARDRYLSELAMGVDGKATERILTLLRETAEGVVG